MVGRRKSRKEALPAKTGRAALRELVEEARNELGAHIYLGMQDFEEEVVVSERVSTLCLPLDKAVGMGIPVGKITEIYSESGHGKTALVFQILASVIRLGGVAIYIETEHAFDRFFADRVLKALGVPEGIEALVIQPCDTVEKVFQTIDYWSNKLRKKDRKRLIGIAWDSIAATMTAAEEELIRKKGKYFGGQMNQLAYALSQGLRKLVHRISHAQTVLVAVNQVREKVGVMFGEKITTPGGKALRFYASLTLQLTKTGDLYRTRGQANEGRKATVHEPIGIMVCAYAKKNKTFPPGRKAFFPIMYSGTHSGIYDERAWYIYLKDRDLIVGAKKTKGRHKKDDEDGEEHKSLEEVLETLDGRTYTFPGEPGFLELLRTDAEAKEAIRKVILTHDSDSPSIATEADTASEDEGLDLPMVSAEPGEDE